MKPRDYAYEALAEVTATDMSAGRGELNAALKSIREQSGISDSYLLADEIHARARMYRSVMPEVMLTPSALAKHWLRVLEEHERKPARTNQAAQIECATCAGDRFVVVFGRKPLLTPWMSERGITPPADQFLEEVAPCPDCNSQAHPEFRRVDGTMALPPDPAKVRDALSRV